MLGAVLLAVPLAVAGNAEMAAVTGQPTPGAGLERGDAGLLSGLSLTAQRGPVTISAEELEFDYRSRRLTYRGNVTVTQADLTLQSDLIRVTLDEEAPERVREIIAEGAVRIAKGDRRASGGRAVFDQSARTVTLSHGAVLRDGPNEVAGERVVVYLDEERSVVEGGQRRVRAVLFPPGEAGDAPPEPTPRSGPDDDR